MVPLRPVLPALALALVFESAAAAPPRPRHAAPQTVDFSQRFDGNRLGMSVNNVGAFAYDLPGAAPGLEYPLGSGRFAMFAAGLWVGAHVAGETRVTVSEYSSEWLPGSLAGGVADDPNRADDRVYELLRHYSTPAERDAALADYVAGAMPHGAPAVAVLGDGSLDLPGDETFWCVFNDANPAVHLDEAGHTAPLGLEVRERIWGDAGPDPLDHTVFLEFTLFDRGPNTLADTHLGIWCDPDLGQFDDDLVGCDTLANLGYCYNATNSDLMYGANPPALGVDLLRGPRADDGTKLPMTAFVAYVNGSDPVNALESDANLHGRDRTGSVLVNPTTGNPTTYAFSGDPGLPGGWVDGSPADKRMLLASGPFTMAPGDTQRIRIALIVSQESDRLSSLARLRLDDAIVQQLDEGVPTAIEVSLATATVVDGEARVAWSLIGDAGRAVAIERARDDGAWTTLATRTPDGTGRLEMRDPGLDPGHRYGYRLRITDETGTRTAGETWLAVPARATLALTGATPNPVAGELVIAFALPDARAARLELADLAGRVVRRREVGGFGAGEHRLDLGGTRSLAAGLYFVRLVRDGEIRTARVTVIR